MTDQTHPDDTAPDDAADPIADLRIFHTRLPVTVPRRHGIGAVSGTVDNVVLRLETAAGVVGWGEGAPWAVFTGTAEAAAAALDRYIRPLVIGQDPRRWTAILRRAEAAVVQAFEAKAALETALLDLAGRQAGLAVCDLLGGRVRDSIPLSVSVANPDFGADRALVRRLYDDGVRLFKLKTGVDSHRFDLMRLEALRGDFPDDLDLRVDYNQGLAPFDALRRLRDVAAFGPTFIEQPVPAVQREAMAALTAALDTPILADESVFSPAEAVRAVRDRICDAVSVKIMKAGGLRRAQEIAAIAEAAGLPAYGGDMFETGIAHLAGTHMIAATPNVSLGCEFYQATYYLEQDLLAMPFPVRDGQVRVPTGPGLGIDVDEDRVRRAAGGSARPHAPGGRSGFAGAAPGKA